MNTYKRINSDLTLYKGSVLGSTRKAKAYNSDWKTPSLTHYALVITATRPTPTSNTQLSALPDLIAVDLNSDSNYSIITNRFELVDIIPIVPTSVPKYLLLVALEEDNFADIETQVTQSIAANLSGTQQSKADKGWRMQSSIRRDNSLLPLIQATVQDTASQPLTTDRLDAAFVSAFEMEQEN